MCVEFVDQLPADVPGGAGDQYGHRDKEYVFTGHEAYTVTEQVRIISETVGRPIEVRAATTPDEIIRFRFPAGAPQPLADAVMESLALLRSDTVGFRTDTVERLLGREPLTFADWCARNAYQFRRPGTA